MTYAILHAHDTYGSIGDSTLYIRDYIKRAKELGIQNLALTNHGSLSTFVEFYNACRAADINPIIGCEFYYADDISVKDKTRYHLILLAKDNTGLKNLIQLHNIAADKGFYYRPRIDFSLLEEYHEGLVCLSACIAGKIPQLILQNDTLAPAIQEANRMKDLFGDDFYLEIQPGDFPEQKTVNTNLAVIAKYCQILLVATNDVHYLRPEDWQLHDYHVKDARKMKMDDPMIYPDTCYYVMARNDLKERLCQIVSEQQAEEALQNTLIIAQKCQVVLPQEKIMPCYDAGIDEAKWLSDLCWIRLKELENKLQDPSIYASRLEYELATIHTLQFDGYFLIVKDIIDYCDKNHIMRGPGRGSAVGSLVSYLLGISLADPIKHNLLFERFLSIKRTSWPDIDLDIEPEKRDQVYHHIIERYGADRCCFVSTFNKRKARAAIKTAARILNQPVETGDMLSKAVPYVSYDELGEKHTDMPLKEVLQTNAEFQRLAKNHMDIVNLAMQIEGYPSSMGIHPAGIVISPVSIADRYPLIRAKDKELHATSLDLNNVEALSGVKFDLLSLANLTTIGAVLEETHTKLDYTNDAFFKEQSVWDLIGSSNTTGLFQISSTTYKSRMPQLKPKSIPELAACLALVRGPCISSGADKKYIDILHQKIQPDPICEAYWKHTEKTCGIIIYQEQVLQICQEIGMDREESYKLLKACSKKKTDQIRQYESKFYMAAREHTISDEVTEKIWAEILNSAKYAFNIAHATAYAILCYTSAWLKIHYPVTYMCHVLNRVFAKPDNDTIAATVQECRRLKISFLDADINLSDWLFTVEDEKIRIGMCAIKGMGIKAFEHIRKQAPFTDFNNFMDKVSGRECNKRIVQLLIAAGTFKKIETMSSKELMEHYIVHKRKESMVTSLKIGKETVDLSQDPERIKYRIYGTRF